MGDAGESVTWLCYTLVSNNQPQRLWLTSGEMGGGERITGMDIEQTEADTKPTKLCPLLPSYLQPIRQEGIKLGMTRNQIVKTLGKPSKQNGSWLIYMHAGKIKDDYDEIGWLIAFIQDGHIARLQTGKTTTN